MTTETETRSRQRQTKENYAGDVKGVFPFDVNYSEAQSAETLTYERLQTGIFEITGMLPGSQAEYISTSSLQENSIVQKNLYY